MKILKGIFLLILGVLLIALLYVLTTFPTVMAGMVAKTVCSCVFVSGRTPESVREKELQVFPGLSSAGLVLNSNDSTVVATILWEESKAIYRKGLGCTLLAQKSEEQIRKQIIKLPASVPNFDSLRWPTGNVMADSLLPGVDYAAVAKAVDSAFVDVNPAEPIFTHGVVVVYNGQIIGERYAAGFNQHSIFIGWSMTKSIINALTGILVKEGKLNVNSPAPIAEWQNDERKDITLNNLLQASSGLKWSESYFIPTSDFHNMFIKSDDKGAYAAGLELAHKPGEFFQYSSGTTNLLSRTIRQTVGDGEYYRLPYEKLFYKIGMTHALLEPDASGTFVGSSYGYATARDWARFGLLYLNDGVWNNTERILPGGWVKYSTTPAASAKRGEYGAQWWLNVGNPKDANDVKFKGLPNESIIADGFENQFVVIVPSKKLVVVRLGVTHNKNFKIAALVNGVIKALPR